jgi:hypothetical protein
LSKNDFAILLGVVIRKTVNLNSQQMSASCKNKYLSNQRARFKPILDSSDTQVVFTVAPCIDTGPPERLPGQHVLRMLLEQGQDRPKNQWCVGPGSDQGTIMTKSSNKSYKGSIWGGAIQWSKTMNF